MISARAFKDHHDFTDMEAQELLDLAAASDAQLVTTEKDLARLKGRSGACGRLARTTRVLGIQLTMESRDLARLEALVQGISVKDKASA